MLLQAKNLTASSIIKLVIQQNIQCQVKSELIVDPVNNTQIFLHLGQIVANKQAVMHQVVPRERISSFKSISNSRVNHN